jgi:hypothetical protein
MIVSKSFLSRKGFFDPEKRRIKKSSKPAKRNAGTSKKTMDPIDNKLSMFGM